MNEKFKNMSLDELKAEEEKTSKYLDSLGGSGFMVDTTEQEDYLQAIRVEIKSRSHTSVKEVSAGNTEPRKERKSRKNESTSMQADAPNIGVRVYMPESFLLPLKILSIRRRVSVSALVREAVSSAYEKEFSEMQKKGIVDILK